jgi:hypothetical protein
MNTLAYKGHYIHIRWVGIKQIAYRVQIMGEQFINREVKSLRAGQLLITNFVTTGNI